MKYVSILLIVQILTVQSVMKRKRVLDLNYKARAQNIMQPEEISMDLKKIDALDNEVVEEIKKVESRFISRVNSIVNHGLKGDTFRPKLSSLSTTFIQVFQRLRGVNFEVKYSFNTLKPEDRMSYSTLDYGDYKLDRLVQCAKDVLKTAEEYLAKNEQVYTQIRKLKEIKYNSSHTERWEAFIYRITNENCEILRKTDKEVEVTTPSLSNQKIDNYYQAVRRLMTLARIKRVEKMIEGFVSNPDDKTNCLDSGKTNFLYAFGGNKEKTNDGKLEHASVLLKARVSQGYNPTEEEHKIINANPNYKTKEIEAFIKCIPKYLRKSSKQQLDLNTKKAFGRAVIEYLNKVEEDTISQQTQKMMFSTLSKSMPEFFVAEP